jgi:hypothetical protein
MAFDAWLCISGVDFDPVAALIEYSIHYIDTAARRHGGAFVNVKIVNCDNKSKATACDAWMSFVRLDGTRHGVESIQCWI